MKNRIISSFIFLSFLFCTSFLHSQEIGSPFIRNYTPKEYNNTGQVWAAFQNEKGLLYFGMTGGGGITEYDGKSWRVIEVPTTVFSFAQDTKKRLYTGAINDFGYIAPDARGKNEFVSLRHLIPEKDLKFKAIWFAVANEDDIYFMAVDAIFKYTSSPEPRIKIYHAGSEGKFTALFRHNGDVYTIKGGEGLLRIGNDSVETVNAFFKDKPARYGLSLSHDSFIIATRKNGLFLLSSPEDIPVQFPVNDTGFAASGNGVYAAAVLPDHNILLGGNARGGILVSPKGEVLQRWNDANGLPLNSIYQIYHSPDRNLWFSTENGIARSEITTAWSYWDKNSGLEGAVMDILRFEGKLYLATLRGIYVIDKNIVHPVAGIPSEQSWRLYVHTTPEKEKILLAGVTTGLYWIKGKSATQIWKGSHTTAMTVDPADPQRILISGNPLLVSLRYEKGKWKDEGSVAGLNENLQESVFDANGELWVSTYAQGILRITPDSGNILKPEKIRYYTDKDGLPTMRIAPPYVLNGEIVFCTEQGLYMHNAAADRMEPYEKLDQFLPNGRNDLLVIRRSDDGTIILLPRSNKTNGAGYLTAQGSGKYSWNDMPLRRLPQMEFESAYRDPDGVLWIGGSEGLFRYDARQENKDFSHTFSALVRKVTIKGDSIISFGETSASTIEYSNNDIKFETAAPFFDDESKTLFSHQLVGYEKNWSPWTSDASAVFTNLDEGEYTFRVKAKNLYEIESSIGEYSLRILPPPYRTWWAYSSYLLLLGISIAAFDRWNKRRLRRQYEKEHVLEQQRKQNVSRLLMERQEQERQRIAGELHDSLGQELLILKHRIELNRRQEGLPLEMKSMFEEHSSSASEILAQLRNISHDLRPPELDKLGLTESIKAILQRVRNTKQMEIVGEIDEIDGFFAKHEEINLIRILQEALNNIMKHSGATRTTIVMALSEDRLHVTISDNGKGIMRSAEGDSGLGMHAIEERVQLLGGTMTIDSSPGAGTTLKFHFPKNKK